jgi:tetratricopeptide (TPR) repeat protein
MPNQIHKSKRKLPPGAPEYSSHLSNTLQDANVPQQEGKAFKSLWRFYEEVEKYEYTDPRRAWELFDQILQEGLDHYTAPPDLWHNTAMVAGRVQHRDAELALILRALQEWPMDVDLLCDELQLRYSAHYDPDRAREIWDLLSSMPREVVGPYWRFWVYGAIYYTKVLRDPRSALALLDEGVNWVTRDTLMDVLRSYRRVLVDGAPRKQLKTPKQLAEYHREMLKILEDRYRLGIALGVENGYVLATELAQLHQEQAGLDLAVSLASPSSAKDGVSEQPSVGEVDHLSRALECLDVAEKLYTGNPNHPVWDIYEARARILMAQRRYGDALKMLRSLPRARQSEPSLATMLRLASYMTGEKVEEERGEALSEALSIFLQNDGQLLFQVASQDSAVAAILKRIVRKLETQEGGL